MLNPEQRASLLAGIPGQVFDVIVIGGGITGSGIARDAQSRGLKTLLVEKSDFASGTSSKSGKLVHGGLRYLNYGQFRMVYEACSERHHLLRTVAPHIVRPVPFLLSFYPSSRPGRLKVAAGLFLYDLLSLFRNVRRFRMLSPTELALLEPQLETKDCQGGLRFYDCMSLDYRLTIDTLKSAHEKGAALLNYCRVTGLRQNPAGLVHGVNLRDELSGASVRARSRVVINAAGAWADDLLETLGHRERFGLKISRGIHLVLDNSRIGISHAIGFQDASNKRQVYAVPWGERLLLGTTDDFYHDSKEQIPVQPSDLEYLFTALKKIFPNARPEREDIISAYAGIRPLLGSDANKSESELSRDFEIRITEAGLVSITGGKLTTYRLMAQSLMNQVCQRFFPSRRYLKSATLEPLSGGYVPRPLPGRSGNDLTEGGEALSPEIHKHLQTYYGANTGIILEYIAKNPGDSLQISSHSPHIWAEIAYAMDHEFAVTLSDVLMRRTTIYMFARDNGLGCCEAVAGYMGTRLGWSGSRVKDEMQKYQNQVMHMRQMIEGSGLQ